MRKKAVLIVVVALSLIAFLIYKSFFIAPKSKVRIVDRLPDTSYKGKIHVLDFSKNIQRNLKEMQVPFVVSFLTCGQENRKNLRPGSLQYDNTLA